jgi:acyl-CoA synthetase (AMP-forming)/AMP-acid ligase II
MSLVSPFQLPSNIRQRLLPEVFLEVAKLNPDYPFAFTLESDIPDASVETVSYKQMLSDISFVARELQKSIPRRHLGEDARGIGILARSSYSYFVHWLACLFNNWTVSTITNHYLDIFRSLMASPLSFRSGIVAMQSGICFPSLVRPI